MTQGNRQILRPSGVKRPATARFLACVVFAMAAAAFGQEEIPLWGIEPVEDPDLPAGGKVMAFDGQTDAVPHHFVVGELKVNQPVSVMVSATNPGDDLKVELSKYSFDQPEASGSTKADGSALFQTRTEGDLKISVSGAAAGMPYRLLVWTGEPIQPPMDPGLVPPAEYARLTQGKTGGSVTGQAGSIATTTTTSSTAGSPVLWVIAALLFVAVALLAVVVLRRRPA
ncbi:MAG TPA: hypothetical protein VNM92_00465 [Thermoanaerobaculia bacterium]|nr:hypothetical protein [Thermoanaerobaculia bacterium]